MAPTLSFRRCKRVCAAFMWLLGAGVGGVANASTYTVGPSSDSSCLYNDAQLAINAASDHAGADTIQISQGSYSAQALDVQDDSDLIITGGATSCTNPALAGTTTLNGVAGESVLNWGGSGNLTVAHLVITGGDSDFFGGGIDAGGSGALNLQDIDLKDNMALDGGGLFVEGGPDVHMQVLLDGVRFNENHASKSGGGLYAVDADITIQGSGDSDFVNNSALGTSNNGGNGGGIFLLNSSLVANTHAPNGLAFIDNNSAKLEGGGIYSTVSEAGVFEIALANDDATRPLEISNNTADQQGGGLYLESISTGQQIVSLGELSNVIIEHNTAGVPSAGGDGAAIAAFASAAGSAMSNTVVHMYQYSPRCTVNALCNSLLGNQTTGGGSVVTMAAEGAAAHTSFLMTQGQIRGNSAYYLLNGIKTVMNVDNSLIAQNTVGELVDDDGADVRITNTTIAGNTATNDALMVLEGGSLEILHDLIFQPNNVIYGQGSGSPATVTVLDLLTANTTGLPNGNNIQLTGDPRFVNAATGDFHLNSDSPAIDRWAPIGDSNDPPPTTDLDGFARPHTVMTPTTPYDFGAYEFGSSRDEIFANGFD